MSSNIRKSSVRKSGSAKDLSKEHKKKRSKKLSTRKSKIIPDDTESELSETETFEHEEEHPEWDEEEDEDEDEEEEDDEEDEEEEEETELFEDDSQIVIHHQTVLNVPTEAMSGPIDIVSKNKEICSLLEGAMVEWISQIKEILSNQTMQDAEDWSGPLDEITFWQARNQDLTGLISQLRSNPIRTVQRIMTIVKSPFINSFNKVSSEILGASGEAISNLHYLSVLVEPCKKLHESKVAEIPDQIQNILWLARIIWLNSPYYNTRERLNGLFRKVSNEIVGHCIQEINVDRLFAGYLDSSEMIINDCIKCLKFWKDKYFEAQKMHSMNSYLTWLLEYGHILSHVDVFLHRLQDLLEICTCQRLYARRVEGYEEPFPLYPGVKGPEMTRVMKEVQKTLYRNLREMYQAKDLILNVRNTQWHEHMVAFKTAVRDIEMKIQNILFFAFESITNLEQGIQILETFYAFYNRDIITRAYDKLIMKLYKLFEDETNIVRNLFTKNILPLPLVYPTFAGRASWALFLQRRLDIQLDMLKKAWWLPECGYGDDVRDQAKVLSHSLGEFCRNTYQEWLKAVGNKDFTSKLELPLMRRSTYKFGMIEVNFDKALSAHIIESEMWERIGYEIPEVLQNVYYERERLHNLRETVLLVVKDYNRIISALSPEERLLFKERIKILDRKIYPGLTKLIWSSDVSDSYIRDCRMAAIKVQSYITDYKHANIKIGKLAKKMSNHLMIKVDRKRVHDKTEFNDYQDEYRSKAILKIATQYKNITVILVSVFEMFKTDGPEVQTQWMKYLKKIDKIVEEALCLNMRKSLEVLNRAVHGDLRGPPPPMFKIAIILENKKLEFDPSLPVVEDMILGIFRRICICITPFPRVVQYLNDPDAQVMSFAQVISKDEVCKTSQENIADGIRDCIAEIEKYLQSWEPYRDVWELDKNVFMQLYEKQNPSTQSYSTDIGRYAEVLDAVQGCESVMNVVFCVLDSSALKDVLSAQCHDWQSRLMKSLLKRGNMKLTSVFTFMEDALSRFKKMPKTLPDLVNSVNMFREYQLAVQALERSLPKVFEHFDILKKYDFDIGSQSQARLDSFEADWNTFAHSFKEIETMLRNSKEHMKKAVMSMAEDFKKKVDEFVGAFESQEWPDTEQEASIQAAKKFRQTLNKLKKDEQSLLTSLIILKINQGPNEDLRKTEKDLIRMENLLGIEDVSVNEPVAINIGKNIKKLALD